MKYQVCVIGGGAAGFFTAVNLARMVPSADITILEKSSQVLGKVKISGGGRCNVTHACFDPRELIQFYPRGGRELLGPFHQFQPGDTIEWFQERGVSLKTESDGRMFPVSDNSQTIIDCFMREAEKHAINIRYRSGVQDIRRVSEGWELEIADGKPLVAHSIVLTAGSSSQMWEILKKLGHTIVEPVPSLFTLNIAHPLLTGMAGISMPSAAVSACGYETTGPILITHWGLSGPAILKLSAFAARKWNEIDYQTTLRVNWTGRSTDEQMNILRAMRDEFSKKMASNVPPVGIPAKWWTAILGYCGIEKRWSDMNNRELQAIADVLCNSEFAVKGKSTFKEEFVTAGGIKLSEVNFKTMESKILPGVYFAGEVLDIDAVTGGFNFQAAWTTSFIAANHLATQIAQDC